jgi:hypothetical protein
MYEPASFSYYQEYETRKTLDALSGAVRTFDVGEQSSEEHQQNVLLQATRGA